MNDHSAISLEDVDNAVKDVLGGELVDRLQKWTSLGRTGILKSAIVHAFVHEKGTPESHRIMRQAQKRLDERGFFDLPTSNKP